MSDNLENLVLISHSHLTIFVSEIYSINLQLFSHRDKYLLLNSFALFIKILLLSSPHSDEE